MEVELNTWRKTWPSTTEGRDLGDLLLLQGLTYLHLPFDPDLAVRHQLLYSVGIQALDLQVRAVADTGAFEVISTVSPNLVHSIQRYWTCITVVWSIIAQSRTNGSDNTAFDEASRANAILRVSQCRCLLANARRDTPLVKTYTEIFEKFTSILLARLGDNVNTAIVPPPLIRVDVIADPLLLDQQEDAVIAEFRRLLTSPSGGVEVQTSLKAETSGQIPNDVGEVNHTNSVSVIRDSSFWLSHA